MKQHYISTRNKENSVDFYQAILQGLSKDGGLFFPDFSLPKCSLEAWAQLDYATLASEILKCFVPKNGHDFITQACIQVYGGDLFVREVVPVKKAGDIYIAELFHGPTAAFKDMALTLLPYLMTLSLKMQGEDRQVMILAATSGDTGKAALEGFKDVPGTKIKVFYPSVGVSAIQKQQMVTQLGKNVEVVGIEGNFDDAQSAVKVAFNDQEMLRLCHEHDLFLSSANSINIGRLLPQIVYYFYSYFKLVSKGEIKLYDKVNFCIPSGNFGNALAGFMAKEMGLPVHRFICASNKNHILTDFFTTGEYDTQRIFYKTNAPAMDILVSSNLERFIWLMSQKDEKKVISYMDSLKTSGKYQLDKEVFDSVSHWVKAGYASEKETLDAIKKMYKDHHYLLDTHTATGYHVYKEYQSKTKDKHPTILMATASPYKFAEAVYEALTGETLEAYDAIEKLHRLTGVSIPKPLQNLKEYPVRFEKVIDKKEIVTYIKERIKGGDHDES